MRHTTFLKAAMSAAVLFLACMPAATDPGSRGGQGGGNAAGTNGGGRGGAGGSGGSGGAAGSPGSGGSASTGGASGAGGGGGGGAGSAGSAGSAATGGSGSEGTGGTGAGGTGGGSEAGSGGGGSGGGSAGSSGGSGGPADGGAMAPDGGGNPGGPPFSFFVTSIEAMRKLSGSQNGFGGNLGGLTGADKICQDIAADNGGGQKTWRAFLSATKGGPGGGPVHAIDRIGNGPWYDRNGRLIAMDRAGLLRVRPAGAAQAIADLANERGLPQKQYGDNHDVITGSNKMGMLSSTDPAATCQDWTNAAATAVRGLMCGHSWSRVGSQHWLNEHPVPGCAPGVNLRDNTVMPGNCIGCNGGYGAIYCFALSP